MLQKKIIFNTLTRLNVSYSVLLITLFKKKLRRIIIILNYNFTQFFLIKIRSNNFVQTPKPFMFITFF